jgi:hypothetical protein
MPVPDNRPLSMWSNRWSTMPIRAFPDIRLPRPDDRAFLDHVPGSSVPVLRQPFDVSDYLPYWAMSHFEGEVLYDRAECDADGAVRDHLADGGGTAEAKEMADLMVEALRSIGAPDEQLVRLGLS